MSAHFCRTIHQQAQVSSLETLHTNLESQTIVLMSNYIDNGSHYLGFRQLLLQDSLDVRRYDHEAASEPHLPKVACCIPVLSSRYIGKRAARVLKRSGCNHFRLCGSRVNKTFKYLTGEKNYDVYLTIQRLMVLKSDM